MAEHRRRRAKRGRAGADSFLPPLPKDEGWLAALRPGDDGDDWLTGEVPAGDGADEADAAGDEVTWAALEAELDEQRALILALTAKVESLEAALEALARRLPPAADGVPPVSPTVREAIDAIRMQARDAGARLAREVAAKRGARHDRLPPA